MSNIIKLDQKTIQKEYVVDQQSLDELASISRRLSAAQSAACSHPCACCERLAGIEYLGELLSSIERGGLLETGQ